jgi:hypothetical protein
MMQVTLFKCNALLFKGTIIHFTFIFENAVTDEGINSSGSVGSVYEK